MARPHGLPLLRRPRGVHPRPRRRPRLLVLCAAPRGGRAHAHGARPRLPRRGRDRAAPAAARGRHRIPRRARVPLPSDPQPPGAGGEIGMGEAGPRRRPLRGRRRGSLHVEGAELDRRLRRARHRRREPRAERRLQRPALAGAGRRGDRAIPLSSTSLSSSWASTPARGSPSRVPTRSGSPPGSTSSSCSWRAGTRGSATPTRTPRRASRRTSPPPPRRGSASRTSTRRASAASARYRLRSSACTRARPARSRLRARAVEDREAREDRRAHGYRSILVQAPKRRSFYVDGVAKALGFSEYYGMEDMPRLSRLPLEGGAVRLGPRDLPVHALEARPRRRPVPRRRLHRDDPHALLDGERFTRARGEGRGRLREHLHYSDWAFGEFSGGGLDVVREHVFVFCADTWRTSSSADLRDSFRILCILFGKGIAPRERRRGVAGGYPANDDGGSRLPRRLLVSRREPVQRGRRGAE